MKKFGLVFFIIACILFPCFSEELLILHSYHYGFPWSGELQEVIHRELDTRMDLHIYVEYMDTKRFSYDHAEEVMLQIINDRYNSMEFDGIIVIDDNALNFVNEYHEDLFTDVPVVFCGINTPLQSLNPAVSTGVLSLIDVESSIYLALDLFENHNHLYFIHDSSETGMGFYSMIRHKETQIKQLYPDLVFIDISSTDYTLKELLELAIWDDPEGLFFFINWNEDSNLRYLDSRQSLEQLTQSKEAPFFTMVEIYENVIGGSINSAQRQGAIVSEMITSILDGTNPQEIPIQDSGTNITFVNYPQLEKWNISNINFSKDVWVRNKPQTIWGQYRSFVLEMIGVFMIFILIIMMLIGGAYKRQKLTERLQEAIIEAKKGEELKASFIANLYHEIRTPLNAIFGFSRIIGESKIGEIERVQFRAIVEYNIKRLLSMIEDIIDLSRIDQDDVYINKEMINLNRIMRELYQLYTDHRPSFIFPVKPIELYMKLDAPDREAQITTDKKRLIQIMKNLLDNAYKFTEKGTIVFGYKKLDSQDFEFFVTDTGIGISPEFHKTIFNRFKQVDDSIKRSYRGNGLGLSISKVYIEKMGGGIELVSSPGMGTTFKFILPKQ